MSDVIVHLIKELRLAWKEGGKWGKFLLFVSFLVITVGALVDTLGPVVVYYARDARVVDAIAKVFYVGGAILLFVIYSYRKSDEEFLKDTKIEEAEKRVQDNPKETRAAWDLARIKLESYLNRNLSQVRSIFWLTAFVMLVGFALIGYGVVQAFETPADKFNAALLSSISGLLINFIGATFLILYKSTMAQAQEYVAILERINAVGMSVQVLEKLEGSNDELRHNTIADLSKQLLALYQQKGKL